MQLLRGVSQCAEELFLLYNQCQFYFQPEDKECFHNVDAIPCTTASSLHKSAFLLRQKPGEVIEELRLLSRSRKVTILLTNYEQHLTNIQTSA